MKHLPPYKRKSSILLVFLSLFHVLFLCQNTYTDPNLFFLLPVSHIHLLHSLWYIISLSFSRHYVIHFEPFNPRTPLHTNCKNTCMPIILLFLHIHSIGIWILLLMLLSFLWNVIFFRILSCVTDSNLVGYRPHYAIAVRCDVFATVCIKATDC